MNVLGVLEEMKEHGPKDFDYDRLATVYNEYLHQANNPKKVENRTRKVWEKVKAIHLTTYSEILRVRTLPGFDANAYANYGLFFDTPQLYEHKQLVRLERNMRTSLKSLLANLEKAISGTEETQGEQQPGS